MASTVTRSPSNLWDLVEREIRIMDVQPTNVGNTLLNLCHEEVMQFWREKGVQPGTSKVYLIKWPVSVFTMLSNWYGNIDAIFNYPKADGTCCFGKRRGSTEMPSKPFANHNAPKQLTNYNTFRFSEGRPSSNQTNRAVCSRLGRKVL